MNITDIVAVSPVNPAHGRHEVHAVTNEGIGVALQISPEALGCLTAYFDTFPHTDKAYANFIKSQEKTRAASTKKKGS